MLYNKSKTKCVTHLLSTYAHHINLSNNHNCNRISEFLYTRCGFTTYHYRRSWCLFLCLLFCWFFSIYLKERIKVPLVILLILLLLWLLCLPRWGLLLQQLIHGGFLILGYCLKRIWRMLFEWITCGCKWRRRIISDELVNQICNFGSEKVIL